LQLTKFDGFGNVLLKYLLTNFIVRFLAHPVIGALERVYDADDDDDDDDDDHVNSLQLDSRIVGLQL